MTSVSAEKRKVDESSEQGDSVLSIIIRYVLLIILDTFALIFVYSLVFNGEIGLATAIGIATIGANIIAFVPSMGPLRWMLPGLFLAIIFVIYPIYFTVATAFTNYGDGNLLNEQQLANLLDDRPYIPDDAITYQWTLFQSETDADSFALWMTRTTDEGDLEVVFAPENSDIVEVDTDVAEPPEVYEGYLQLSRRDSIQFLQTIQQRVFGTDEDSAGIDGPAVAVRPLESLYVWNPDERTYLNNETGDLYIANDDIGYYVNENDPTDRIIPGYRSNVGFENFSAAFTDNVDVEGFENSDNFFDGFLQAFSGPLITIFIWTVLFAFLSVFTTFWMGLFMAIVLEDAKIPGKKIIRSLLIIPYAMPGVISILIWRGMLNQELGLVTQFIESLTGFSVPWFGEPFWARSAIVLVNLWLGYPYMMLICSGALQAIPSDIYEAAAVDGATPSDRFWKITMPLLLVTVGPLLIASYVYNFNNYLLIEALTAGDPPIPGSDRPAGFTDILISYVYSLAFNNNRGADYGYASAITIIIFFLVAGITMIQFRFTKQWEEVGENV
ncbi:MAG: ABC transporter permease subunit [Chloroflexota bacterium]